MEVFSNALLSAAEEMGALLIRTAYSTNIKERQDASTAIFDAQGRTIAQAEHIPIHLGALLSIVTSILKRYRREDLRPGDAFLANDAYHGGGTHLADVTVASPVFHGRELVGFVANMGHWPDVGGIKPGAAMTEGCTEIYQEGLRIPPMRITRRGELDENLFSFILLNMRFAEDRPADLRAQLAANEVGIRRLQALCARYGVRGFRSLIEGVLDYNERCVRARIHELPEGTWSFEDQLDNDGHDPEPVQINTNNIPSLPAEILESEYPIRVERFAVVPNSGGAGEYRGGLATQNDFRMLADTSFIAHADRHEFAPWAIGGAREGAP
ncbi:MAG: hypothetical protein A3G24_11965 [Betaproteobacteria bacterium RIFCSPLOWO2_12_FULL_62_13]|nr:MAG: hypothetical protein A3G24_11965 [Betaproteobacteria bacterium RIFCSPLOWO2_12_FULL_62_13]